MGFPPGGFQLYRPPSSAGPKPLCFSLQQTATGSVPAEILAGKDKVALRLLNGTIKVTERQLAQPPYNAAGEFFQSFPPSPARGTIKVLELLAAREPQGLELHAHLPFACHEIALLFEMPVGSRVILEAYDGSRRVDAVSDASRAHTIREIHH